MEPYYPVNDEKNNALFEEYKKLAEKEENVIFGGRLGDYKYYDMDKVVAAALDRLEEYESHTSVVLTEESGKILKSSSYQILIIFNWTGIVSCAVWGRTRLDDRLQ